MARQLGSKSTVAIPLSELVAKLPANQSIAVGKGWLKAIETANGVTFGVTEGGENAATVEDGGKVTVDID